MQLCEALKCSWRDLRDMPEFYVEVWEAYLSGRAFGQANKAKLSGSNIKAN